MLSQPVAVEFLLIMTAHDNIKGVEAVIDKDYTSSLLASELKS